MRGVGSDYSREAVNRGMAIIGGKMVYHNPLKFACVPESFWEGFQSDQRWFGFQVVFMNLVWYWTVASQLLHFY